MGPGRWDGSPAAPVRSWEPRMNADRKTKAGSRSTDQPINGRPDDGLRKMALKALHAEATKRGLAHSYLHDLAEQRFGVDSLARLDQAQLREMYKAVTGKALFLKHRGVRSAAGRRAAGTAGRGDEPAASRKVARFPSADDFEMLAATLERLGWTRETFSNFVRRQLKGRGEIVTLADFNKVYWAMKGISQRRVAGTGKGTADERG